ncbi:MAG: hypothetical protein R3277_02960 [Brumimicrobium sp.]|nr:hypothetical protein [Brumimicrobium sp.]
MNSYKVRTYRAVDSPALNRQYVEGHANVLKDYGVTMITSLKPTWTSNPNVYCVVAYDKDNVMVGGIRIQVADWKTPLPMETAIAKLDEGIYDLVKKYKSEGVGELCGLWNAKSVAGVGLSYVLTRAAVSIVNQLNFNVLMGICAEYSLKMFKDVGFEIDTSLSNNGEFPYPTNEYITRVVGILHSSSLRSANPFDREIILFLRDNIEAERIETGKKGEFLVDYDLNVKPEPV